MGKSKPWTERDYAGFGVLVGIVCVSVGVGILWGTAWGLIAFGSYSLADGLRVLSRRRK